MDVCLVNQAGEVLLHRDMKAAPEPFLKARASDREALVVCVEGMFTWSWLADLCAHEGSPCVLGHALSMKAIHGGKATHARSDAHHIAVLWRGGMLPQASVSPAGRRATRDLLRRRRHLTRNRAEVRAPLHQTNSPYHRPEIGTKRADKANRDGLAERFPASAVQTSLDLDLTLIDPYDRWLTDLARDLVRTAKAHAAQTCYRLRSIPGVGKLLARVLLYASHALQRCPRVPACVAYGRLVKGATESAGNRSGTAGQKIGKASLTWACAEAAVLCLRHNPAGQTSLARLVNKHGQGNA